ncbi:MAG: nuclear transport factor 2 family protein [Candidatus Omnitrophica bacterium]|nr:nuclear transport factor 2 family protein [Candidatus Omnitrophota bacterium]
MKMKDWLNQLFTAIDRKDVDAFVTFFCADAKFRFANAPVVCNRENIRNTVSLFFSSIKGLQHRMLAVWQENDVVICEGEVIYTTNNDRKVTLPFVDIIRLKNELIADYRVYIDVTPLNNPL